MKWTEIKIRTTYEAAEAVGEILYKNGANGLVVEDIEPTLSTVTSHDWDYSEIPETAFPPEEVRLVAYLPTTPDLPQTIEDIKEAVHSLQEYGIEVGEAFFTLTEVAELDWANSWKQYYKPVILGKRMVIKPKWERWPHDAQQIVIDIDPGMAFGTGTHATTSMCLILLEQYVQKGYDVYDVGCGSGILSIAAAKLGADKVTALDKDEIAVKVAQENVALNNLAGSVNVERNNLLDGVTRKVDVIVANITAGILMQLIPTARNLISPQGVFILSGIITDRELEVQHCLLDHGMLIIDRRVQGDWVALVAQIGVQHGPRIY